MGFRLEARLPGASSVPDLEGGPSPVSSPEKPSIIGSCRYRPTTGSGIVVTAPGRGTEGTVVKVGARGSADPAPLMRITADELGMVRLIVGIGTDETGGDAGAADMGTVVVDVCSVDGTTVQGSALQLKLG